MTLSLETNDRHHLYDRYLSTHFGSLHPPSPATLERERRVWREYFVLFLPADKGARLADLGCGYGSFLYFLRAEGYGNAWGVDVSPEQIETARNLGISNVVQGDCGEFLERHPGEFDCLTAFDLLEHLPKNETLSLLQAAHRALKPGGRLILRTPNADGPFGAKILYSDFTHEQAFTPRSIRQVLAAAGFSEIEVHPEGPRVHGLISGARWAAWKCICFLLLLYLAAETGQVHSHMFTQNLITIARKSEAGNSSHSTMRRSPQELVQAFL